MKIEKRVLARLPKAYAVRSLLQDPLPAVVFASEDRFWALLFQAPDWNPQPLWDGPGGCMSITPVPGCDRRLLAIQGFFPIFDAAGASLVMHSKPDNSNEPWVEAHVADVPFLHRAELITVNQTHYNLAAALCGGKAFQDDWSKPGALYISEWDPAEPNAVSFLPLLEGLPKNHGLTITQGCNRQAIFVASGAGLHAIYPTERPPSEWQQEHLLEQEVSDVVVSAMDGDGINELITIEPFHGEHLVTYRQTEDGFCPITNHPLRFGHALWAGQFFGQRAVITGSRDGEKALTLCLDDSEPILIESGVASAQVTSFMWQDTGQILSANHGCDGVARYTVMCS